MASATSFKVQCPSCEAMVPIRNPKLIGKKTDCPSCKYRFIVEDPGSSADDFDDEDSPKKKGVTGKAKLGKPGLRRGEDGDSDSKKKKKEGGSTMMLGVGLAVIALLLLGVGAFFLFGGSGGSSDDDDDGDIPIVNNTGGGGGPSFPSDDSDPEDKGEDTPKTVGNVTGPNITNLLPNDAQLVAYLRTKSEKEKVPGLTGSSLRNSLLETAGAFDKRAFEESLGFKPTEISQLVLAMNPSRQWSFAAIRTNKDIELEDLKTRLVTGSAATETIKKHEYYVANKPLDSLSMFLLRGFNGQKPAIHLYNRRTLVMADVSVMKEFLTNDREFAKISEPVKVEESGGPSAPGGNNGITPPGGNGNPGIEGIAPPGGGGYGGGDPASGGYGGGDPASGGFGGGDPASGGGYGGDPASGGGYGGGDPASGGYGGGPGGLGGQPKQKKTKTLGSFLTVKKHFKSMFDQLEHEEQILTVAIDDTVINTLFLTAMKDVDLGMAGLELKDLPIDSVLRGMGISVGGFDETRFTSSLALNFKNSSIANTLRRAVQKGQNEVMKQIAESLKEKYKLDVAVPSGGKNPSRGGNTNSYPSGPGGPGASYPSGPGGPGESYPSGPGGPGESYPSGPGGPGESYPSGPGGPGESYPSGPGGPGASYPTGPGGPGTGGSNNKSKASRSRFQVSGRDYTVIFTADLELKDNIKLYRILKDGADEMAIQANSQATMVNHRSRMHELAEILQQYAKAKGEFPRGTMPRRFTPEHPLPFAPSERVSWLASMLPYLGSTYKNLTQQISDGYSWDEGSNQALARTLIPHFLAPNEEGNYPPSSWRSQFDKIGTAIATHYVGVAGLGFDAAEYSKSDATMKAKLGIFGYDRTTKLEEIADGKENTIAVLQVPAKYRTCWLAGGGSTIRGIPEKNPVEPFVCVTYKGKPGTYALMADGRVRFIPADIDPNTFKAMCTIAGGESIGDLDGSAPLVPKPVTEVILRPTLPKTGGGLPTPNGGSKSTAPPGFGGK